MVKTIAFNMFQFKLFPPFFPASTSASANLPPPAKCVHYKKTIRTKDDHSKECEQDPGIDDSDNSDTSNEAKYVESESDNDTTATTAIQQ